MSLLNVLDISGSGMTASSVRLSAISSNLANAESGATTPEEAYKAKQPVFKTIYDKSRFGETGGGVEVSDIQESTKEPRSVYQPSNPLANEDGMVFYPSINPIEQMADMISASRTYSNQVETFKTTKQLISQTLNMGQ